MEQYLLDELAATAEKLAAGSGPLAAGLVSLVAGLQQLAGLREMEAAAAVRGRELLRGVLQLSLDLQAAAEVRVPGGVSGADGITRRRAECGHDRRIATVLGEVRVSRIAYRAGVKGVPSLFPRDAVLNLPPRSFSWELQRLAVLFARDVPYGRAAGFVEAVTGVRIGTRQIQEIVLAAAADADAFRQHRHQCQHQHRDQDQDQDQERERERERDQEREREREAGDGVPLVISADGKGVAMRPEARRAASVAPQDRVRVFEHRAGTGEKGCKRESVRYFVRGNFFLSATGCLSGVLCLHYLMLCCPVYPAASLNRTFRAAPGLMLRVPVILAFAVVLGACCLILPDRVAAIPICR